jgi:hypothetical protein
MSHPVVSRRSWQLADLSRTVDDTMLALEYSRLHLTVAPPASERKKLQHELAEIIDAVLMLVMVGGLERTVRLSSSRDVVVPNSIVEALRRRTSDETGLQGRLTRLASELREADSLDGELIEVLETIAEAADVEATTSMRPLMRK